METRTRPLHGSSAGEEADCLPVFYHYITCIFQNLLKQVGWNKIKKSAGIFKHTVLTLALALAETQLQLIKSASHSPHFSQLMSRSTARNEKPAFVCFGVKLNTHCFKF